MRLDDHWDQIREIVTRGRRSTGHFTIASVGPDSMPNATPVGTVFLRDDCTGFYFDQYTSALAANLEVNPWVCLMAVDHPVMMSHLWQEDSVPEGDRRNSAFAPGRSTDSTL
ncbi:pyridoxamine 5'-phosphate oxidase family protein [Nocardia sp. NPDC049526]|uniref:pyridoxamine 5'-phosphate oxidase family protein n=1 Tax=Nocardia sp. NPDC049526 TaxID=3364316 RepID=UPI00379ABF0F